MERQNQSRDHPVIEERRKGWDNIKKTFPPL